MEDKPRGELIVVTLWEEGEDAAVPKRFTDACAGPPMAEVKLSNPDKVLFPDDGITKAELAEHYARVAEFDGPALQGPADEPVALEQGDRRRTSSSSSRCPRARRTGSRAARCRAARAATSRTG